MYILSYLIFQEATTSRSFLILNNKLQLGKIDITFNKYFRKDSIDQASSFLFCEGSCYMKNVLENYDAIILFCDDDLWQDAAIKEKLAKLWM